MRNQTGLLLALAVSLVLHGLVIGFSIHGGPEIDPSPIPTKVTLQLDLSRRVSIATKHSGTLETVPELQTQPAIPAAIATKALSRQPELIENSLDASIGWPDGEVPHGVLTLRLTLDRTGQAVAVKVIDSSMRRDIEGAVIKQFFGARYRPGEINGLPVNSDIVLSIGIAAEPLPDRGNSPVPAEATKR